MTMKMYEFEEEEEVLRSPLRLRTWLQYLMAAREAPFEQRAPIFERAVKSLPGSFKIWHFYLTEHLNFARNLPCTHSQFQTLNTTFERALVTMHKMPQIWVMYLKSLIDQNLVTLTRRTFDRSLRALPVTQHHHIWGLYLKFASQKGVPIETSIRVYRRFLMYDPSGIEDFVDFLVNSCRWQEAAERLAQVLNHDRFNSVKGKTRHTLWLQLCTLLTHNADQVSGLNPDGIIRAGIGKFTDEVGGLWVSLADYYIRRNSPEKARDVFEEAMSLVVTVRDFSVVFDAYSQFEETSLSLKMDCEDTNPTGDSDNDGEEDCRLDFRKLDEKLTKSFWLLDDNDIDLRLMRLEHLLQRRPLLANTVLLRQNPHNVEQWHRRVKLFESDPSRQISTYAEAVTTVDPAKAVGKPHTLWVAFAKLYESHQDLANARVVFDKAVQMKFKSVDDLASVWCDWAEMELRHKNFNGAVELLRRATAEKAEKDEPVQSKLHKSIKLWSFYADLVESLGKLESTCAVYERILDLRIATPQIIINYALLLEENKLFEESFKVYERGVKIFKYPHAKDIWVTYLSKFVSRFGKAKLERARALFEEAVEVAPAEFLNPLFLQYAKLEEDHGLAKHAMEVYDKAAKSVPAKDKLSVYETYIARAIEMFGVTKIREIYKDALESGLPEKDLKTMATRYAEMETSLGEIERARRIYRWGSGFADPESDPGFWNKWHDFEVGHGDESSFREMLRIERSAAASDRQVSGVSFPPVFSGPADPVLGMKRARIEEGAETGNPVKRR